MTATARRRSRPDEALSWFGTAGPCPRCGGRHLRAVVARRTEYEQRLEVQSNSRVVAATEPVQVDEEPTDEPVYVTCLRCGYASTTS